MTANRTTPPLVVISQKSGIDHFYPVSKTLQRNDVLWEAMMQLKLAYHLREAKNGSKEAESKLCNRIGQIRRHFPHRIPGELMDQIKKCCIYLRSVGRIIDLANDDPRKWISNRQGQPRW